VVLLVVAEIVAETQEATLCPIVVVVVPLVDAAMLQVEVEGAPQEDDRRTYYDIPSTCYQKQSWTTHIYNRTWDPQHSKQMVWYSRV